MHGMASTPLGCGDTAESGRKANTVIATGRERRASARLMGQRDARRQGRRHTTEQSQSQLEGGVDRHLKNDSCPDGWGKEEDGNRSPKSSPPSRECGEHLLRSQHQPGKEEDGADRDVLGGERCQVPARLREHQTDERDGQQTDRQNLIADKRGCSWHGIAKKIRAGQWYVQPFSR